MPKSKASSKASAAKPRAAKAPKGKAAHGVEPITEGPYSNSGPEYEARIAAGNEKLPDGVVPRLTSPGSVLV